MVRNIFPYISLNIYHTTLEPFRPEIHVNNISTFISYLIHIYIYIYTECPRRNVPNFGRVFLMLNYTDITQNTYIQS